MRKSYPSDVTRGQFEIMRADLSAAKKSTRPRKYDLYDIFCAVLYLLKEGCSWRAIPHDFPKWENVRYHYDIWAAPDENGISLLDRVLRKLVKAERENNGREPKTTMIIVDSKSIQIRTQLKIKVMMREKKIWHKTAYWCRCPGAAACRDGYNC